MTNPVVGQVALKLSDGREFTMILDMEALVEAESAYGKPLPRMMADAAAGFVGAVRAMLYGSLRAKHPRITLGEATAMFMSDSDAVTLALEQAGEAAFPAANASEGKEAGNPPGKPSGRSGAKPASTRKPSGGSRRARST